MILGGCREDTPLEPIGEYANAAVGRERIFSWASETYGCPVCLFRLFYANDLRYGVLKDIAGKVFREEVLDITMGHVNLIWQGDAVAQALLSFEHTSIPAAALNVTGPETVSVRYLASRFGELFGKTPRLEGESAETALLGNTGRAESLFGYPTVNLEQMIEWTAAWILSDGRDLGLPTHFEVRDGRY